MPILVLAPQIAYRSIRQWLSILVLALLPIISAAADGDAIDAKRWRNSQLKTISQQIDNSDSEDIRSEYTARQSWLRRWEPGKMPRAPEESKTKSNLIEEPLLQELNMPKGMDADVWHQMISSQVDLLAIDTDDARKENLRATIDLASQLEETLSDHLPCEAKQLPASTAWVLAYTRYRLGRALAYRELPTVREQWPIANPIAYHKQLASAYQHLIDQTNDVRPEFILLEDRMLRRAGNKGRALELLEANRNHIEPKWYLKKRRDLLQELGWEPPYQEAARLYREAGYHDESNTRLQESNR